MFGMGGGGGGGQGPRDWVAGDEQGGKLPAEWGSGVGPLVLPNDLKYLEATGLSRPATSAADDWGLGRAEGGAGVRERGGGGGAVQRDVKAGRRLPPRDKQKDSGLDAGGDECGSEVLPPPPHPRARSAGGAASLREGGGNGGGGDWNAVDISLEYDGAVPHAGKNSDKSHYSDLI